MSVTRQMALAVTLAAAVAAAQGAPSGQRDPFGGAPAKQSASSAKPAAGTPATQQRAAAKPAGKRDPFVSPVVSVRNDEPMSTCATGKRCLVVNQIVLKGVVKSREGMLALVENAAKKTYVLRESDALFNGVVTRITQDSLVMRENTTDNLGRPTTREVVKRVVNPAV